MDLYSNIQNALSKKGINTITGNIYDLMFVWDSWYRGNVNDFHFYKIKLSNGKSKKCERKTMNMAKKVCEDLTKLLWSEKTQINLSNKRSTKALWEVLDSQKNNFTVNFPILIEKMLALGTAVTVEYKDENNETIIDYIDGDLVLPYKYTNSYINGILTISTYIEEEKNKKVYYTHLTYHEFSNNQYIKFNELYKSSKANELGKEVEFSEYYPEIQNPYIINTKNPHFQVFKTNIANNFDRESPLSISVYANSIDRLKAIDEKYDSFDREFDLGKKRILVDSGVTKKQIQADEDGNIQSVNYFDGDDQVYVAIPGMEDQPVKEIDFKLRVDEHIKAINAELNWLSSNVGLGQNFYKFDGQGVKTATEVISENSDTFRTREHFLIPILEGVYDLVSVICELENIKTNSINIIPDDSIIEDKNTTKQRDMQEVNSGLRSKKSYLMKNNNMSEQEAEKELEYIKQEKENSDSNISKMFNE